MSDLYLLNILKQIWAEMKVFKFGGASVNSIARIQQLALIIKEQTNGPLVMVISAMGKTTNALELIANAFYGNEKDTALERFHVLKEEHLLVAKQLLEKRWHHCESQLADFFTEIEWLLHDKPVRQFDYYYDQIVCLGELLSSCIVSHYLQEVGVENEWLDARDLIRTDNNFRDANIDWEISTQKIQASIQLNNTGSANIVVTQGYIAATDDNESTTLGREGSDYSAAIIAHILHAESLTIWKDVAAVMNGDPKAFPDAVLIPTLSYSEVIEMAYYGAQVIHPKTIKPLQNKQIPLYVKCFLDTSLLGTTIHQLPVKNLPPIIVIKQNQVMVTMNTQDYSFVADQHIIELYSLFEKLHVKPNLMQTTAISVLICMDDYSDKINQLASAASGVFDVQIEKGLTLLTIRHYNESVIKTQIENKKILLQQQTKETVQVLYQ